MKNVPLKCACGKVQGLAKNVAPKTGNRIVCHCTDCQNFAQYLKSSTTLDEHGGTDIFQMPLNGVEITQGKEHIQCIRWNKKGLFRWYADCCKTPMGNTMSSKVAFIGVIHDFMDDAKSRDENLGPVRAYVMIPKEPTPKRKATSMLKAGPQIILKLITWKLKGLNKPSSFFEEDGTPIATPKIMS